MTSAPVSSQPLINLDLILSVGHAIAEKFNPEKIILFGSYAYGNPSSESDVDLLVVMPFEGHESQQALAIRRQIRMPFPADILVRSPQQIHERLLINDWFIREIIEKGRVLYAATNPRVD